MTALNELQTIIQVSRAIRQDTPDDNSAVCQLLDQWAGRNTLQAQKEAWTKVGVGQLTEYRHSCGFVRWALQAEQRKELTTSFTNLSKYGSFSPADDAFLQLLIGKMIADIRFPLSEEWKSATSNLFYCIRDWEANSDNVAPAVLKSIERARGNVLPSMIWRGVKNCVPICQNDCVSICITTPPIFWSSKKSLKI